MENNQSFNEFHTHCQATNQFPDEPAALRSKTRSKPSPDFTLSLEILDSIALIHVLEDLHTIATEISQTDQNPKSQTKIGMTQEPNLKTDEEEEKNKVIIFIDDEGKGLMD